MTDLIVVLVIVAAAAAFIFRNFFRTVSGKSGGCGCGPDCGSCASAGQKDCPEDLKIIS